MAATMEILFATSSFFLRLQILFTVRYPLITENNNALETRTPMNFSNKDKPSVPKAKTGVRKKMTHIKILCKPNIQIPL